MPIPEERIVIGADQRPRSPSNCRGASSSPRSTAPVREIRSCERRIGGDQSRFILGEVPRAQAAIATRQRR